jgi:hypothetical protein
MVVCFTKCKVWRQKFQRKFVAKLKGGQKNPPPFINPTGLEEQTYTIKILLKTSTFNLFFESCTLKSIE